MDAARAPHPHPWIGVLHFTLNEFPLHRCGWRRVPEGRGVLVARPGALTPTTSASDPRKSSDKLDVSAPA
jgi:hypothetical protein